MSARINFLKENTIQEPQIVSINNKSDTELRTQQHKRTDLRSLEIVTEYNEDAR